MNKKALAIAVLIIVAAGLGYVAMTKGQKAPVAVPPVQQASTSTAVGSSGLTYEQADAIFKNSRFDDLATKEAGIRYSEAIRTLATTSAELSFYSCVPTPKVIEIGQGDTLKVRNAGTSSIEVRFIRGYSRELAPGTVTEIKGIYASSSAYYTFSCNGRGPAGAVVISE
jgi:endonuclease YncB( thermonuclease family)